MRKQNGITLIALIITIIVMLVLVGVSVTVALNGGLFSTAKKGASKTEIAAEKETMVSIVMGAVKQDGQVDFAKLKNNLPEEFEEISEGKYKSTKTGVTYIVGRYGTLTYEEPFNAEAWDSNASEEDCFVWASDTPGTEGYGTVVGYTEKAQGNTKLVFPSRCTKIEYLVDYNTTETYGEVRAYVQGIEKIEIPGTVTSICDRAFGGGHFFNSVKEVNIEHGVTSIGDYAFYNTGLTNITIPESVTSIGDGAFSGTPWYEAQEDGLIYIGKVAYAYKGEMQSNTSIEIKEGTTMISGYAFRYCTGLTSVTIPDSVTSIGNWAFEGCQDLIDVIIPDTAAIIENGAFNGTPWYESQEDGLIYIGKVAYAYKGEMPNNTRIEIKEGTTSIGSQAFEGCPGLTSITIPDSVTSIGHSAFSNCTGLTNVTIPDSVTSIGYSTFLNCTGLTNITIPDSVTSIGDHAFNDCRGLTNIIIPDSVTSIGYSAFSNCTGLTNITIPDSVTSIGHFAFSNCTGLTSITIPDGVTNIGERIFQGCTGLTSVTIPNSVTSIGRDAFSNCTSLKTLGMPKSVKTIGEGAFSGCTALENIIIWINVDTMGRRVFGNWGSTQTVNIEAGSVPSGWEEGWNQDCNAKIEYGYTGQ